MGVQCWDVLESKQHFVAVDSKECDGFLQSQKSTLSRLFQDCVPLLVLRYLSENSGSSPDAYRGRRAANGYALEPDPGVANKTARLGLDSLAFRLAFHLATHPQSLIVPAIVPGDLSNTVEDTSLETAFVDAPIQEGVRPVPVTLVAGDHASEA